MCGEYKEKLFIVKTISISDKYVFLWSPKFLSTDSTVVQFWKCHSVNYRADDLKAVTTLQYTYLVYLLKLVELVETVFFVLRKKTNQISKLHVYHHVSTACLCWIMVKYNGGKWEKYFITQVEKLKKNVFISGGMILFSIVLNSCVHVLMYSYYFAALFGPAVQQKLVYIKRNITLIQMVSLRCRLVGKKRANPFF